MHCLISTSDDNPSAVELHARLARYLVDYTDRDPDRIAVASCLLLASRPGVVLCFSGIESRAEHRRLVATANEFAVESACGLFQTPQRERLKSTPRVLTAGIHLHPEFHLSVIAEPDSVHRVQQLVDHVLTACITEEQTLQVFLVDSGGREIHVRTNDLSDSTIATVLRVASVIRLRCDSRDLVTTVSFRSSRLPSVTINLVGSSDNALLAAAERILTASVDDRVEMSYIIVTIPNTLPGELLDWPEIGARLLLPSGQRFDSSGESGGALPESALVLQANAQSPRQSVDRGSLASWLAQQFGPSSGATET